MKIGFTLISSIVTVAIALNPNPSLDITTEPHLTPAFTVDVKGIPDKLGLKKQLRKNLGFEPVPYRRSYFSISEYVLDLGRNYLYGENENILLG